MKRFSRYGIPAVTLLFIAVSLFVVNCKKSAFEPTSAESLGVGLVSSCGDTLKANTVLGLVRNDHDPVDDKITLIQYHYALAIRQLAKNPTHRCYMVNAMLADTVIGSGGASLLELAQGNSSFAEALNAQLRGSVNTNSTIYPRGTEQPEPDIETVSASTTWDANSYLKSKTVYAPYSYHPAIYFIKKPASCVPPEGQPVSVMIAQDVDDCDDVAGWRGDEETLMSERDVNQSDEIVIFVGPGKSSTGGVSPLVGENSGANQAYALQASDRGPVTMTTVQIKDGFRYENTGKSEFCGVFRLAPSFSIPSPLTPTVALDFLFNPCKISKKDIADSKLFTGLSANALSDLPQPITGGDYFCVTYERDWWVGDSARKEVKDFCTNNPNNSFFLRMKYKTETYQVICGQQDTFWPGGVFGMSQTNAKGAFSIK